MNVRNLILTGLLIILAALFLQACSKIAYKTPGTLQALSDEGILEPAIDQNPCITCGGPGDPGDPGGPGDPADPGDPGNPPVVPGDDGRGKARICHVPPGNHSAAHVISVGRPAIYAHLHHSGESFDYLIEKDDPIAIGSPCNPYLGVDEDNDDDSSSDDNSSRDNDNSSG